MPNVTDVYRIIKVQTYHNNEWTDTGYIKEGSLHINRKLIADNVIKFGQINASLFEVTLVTNTDVTGENIRVFKREITEYDDDTQTYTDGNPLFTGVVYSCKFNLYKTEAQITAYDKLYNAVNLSGKEWLADYNENRKPARPVGVYELIKELTKYTYDVDVNETTENLNKLGIFGKVVASTLPADMYLNKQDLTTKELLTQLLEFCFVCATTDGDGKMVFHNISKNNATDVSNNINTGTISVESYETKTINVVRYPYVNNYLINEGFYRDYTVSIRLTADKVKYTISTNVFCNYGAETTDFLTATDYNFSEFIALSNSSFNGAVLSVFNGLQNFNSSSFDLVTPDNNIKLGQAVCFNIINPETEAVIDTYTQIVTEIDLSGAMLSATHLNCNINGIPVEQVEASSGIYTAVNDITDDVSDIQTDLGNLPSVYDTGNTSVTCNANTDVIATISFNRTFTEPPMVVACYGAETSYNALKSLTALSVDAITTTGFTVKISNTTSTGRTPRVRWIAIGK